MRHTITRGGGRIRHINFLLQKQPPTSYNATNIRPMLSMAQPEDDDHQEDYIMEQSGAKKSWQAQDNIDIQRVTQQAIIHELTQEQTRTIEEVVPWFLNNMPNSYFRQVPQQYRMDHIKAISAVQDANMDLHMNLKTQLPDGRRILTYIRPGKEAGRFLNIIKELPWEFNSKEYQPLSRVQVFTSDDETVSLSIFVYGEEKKSIPVDVETIGMKILDYVNATTNTEQKHQIPVQINGDNAQEDVGQVDRQDLIDYFHKCGQTYIMRSNPRRFLQQKKLYESVAGTECMAVSIEKSQKENVTNGDYWVDIAVANSLPQIALENASRILYQHNYDVVRSHLDMIADGDNGNVCLLRLLVTPIGKDTTESGNTPIILSEDEKGRLIHELKRTKWLDPGTMNLVLNRYPWLGVTRGEIITAFCSLLHPIMGSRNQYAFSLANIFDSLTQERYIPYACSVADLFLARFQPEWKGGPLSDQDFEAEKMELTSKISSDIEDTATQELLLKMVDIVEHTLRTNIFLENRYSLGLRLDPRVLHDGADENKNEIPYGVIFAHGRRFNAFHVRFRDIARGGMRLVTPSSPETFALESARHYEECYGLAFAQQLKNKDIPEGGSKAVNLINCNGLTEEAKQFVMRKSVKAFANTILDLVVETEETKKNVVDFLQKKEVLYLGPDEQVTVEDINWIVQRAAKRGYGTPSAFMSSKPRAGINHKEFGVTSEGVNTYLDVALRQTLGIDPERQEFTVKMTGGPDGDVGGNEIKILIREYGNNVKIVGIADTSGCAEDPDGLDHSELVRLVDNSLSISNFNEDMLGQNGVVHHVTNDDGMKARNSMHNRLKADAFIPAGGRPNTIDIHNYRNFLLPDGSPSSPLIVEGANLFLTGEARQILYDEAGVMIVKDSSANKCGVITSSYEICSAMMLTEDEFFEHKNDIVNEVLIKLRRLAKMEAELLFREFHNTSGSLPQISEVISNAINTATDALATAMDDISINDRDELMPLFKNHLPKTLSDLAFDRINDRVPEQYIKNAIATCIASKMVYKEGTNFIQSLPKEQLADIAFKYIIKEKEMAELKAVLENVDMSEKEKARIIELLEEGGARTALKLG